MTSPVRFEVYHEWRNIGYEDFYFKLGVFIIV